MYCNYVFQSVACLFTFFNSVFQRVFKISCRVVNLSLFFMANSFFFQFKKYLPISRSWRYSSIYFFQKVYCTPFTFRSLIHLKLIFVHGVTQRSRFTFPIYWKDYPVPTRLQRHLYYKSGNCIWVGMFLGSLSCLWFTCLSLVWNLSAIVICAL